MTINVLFDPILGKLRQSDIGVVSVASLIVTDPLVVNNLIVNSNASINTLYGNTINASTVSTNRLISNNIANNSTISTNLLFANGITASLVSATEIHTQKLFSSTATLGLTHISTIDWNLTSGATALVEGQMNWDANQQTAVIGMAGGNVDLALGMELLFPRRVRNSTGSTMPKGTVVYINGVSGNTPTVNRAIATGDQSSAFTLGMTAESIANGATGWVATFGELTGIDLSAYTGGDTLYLSGVSAGLFTNVPQSAPIHYVRVGTVVKATTDGALVVNVINGYELNELHNVVIASLASGQILMSNASNYWYNVNPGFIPTASYPSLGSLAVLNSLSYYALDSRLSLGSLAVQNNLSYYALDSRLSLGSLAVQDTVNYYNLVSYPSLGSLAVLNTLSYYALDSRLSLGSLAVQDTVNFYNLVSYPSLGSLSVLNSLSYYALDSRLSLGSLAVQNNLSYYSLDSRLSLGSLAVQNNLSYYALDSRLSLGSLAVQNNLSYFSLDSRLSLGSLAVLNGPLPANSPASTNRFVTAYNSTTGAFTIARPTWANIDKTLSAIGDISDVFITSPVYGQVLTYDSNLLGWENKTPADTQNLLDNSNFINNSTNGYGSLADGWSETNTSATQGGFPVLNFSSIYDAGTLSGLWYLKEASGSAIDQNGVYTLTESSAVTSATQFSLMGKMRTFSGANRFSGTVGAGNVAGSQTFFAFIRPGSVTGVQHICGYNDGTRNAILYLNGNKAAFNMTGLTPTAVSADVPIEIGKWYLIIGSYDQGAGELNIFVNGVYKSQAVTGTHVVTTNSVFQIGATNSTAHFTGSINCVGHINDRGWDIEKMKTMFAITLWSGVKIERTDTGSEISCYQLLGREQMHRFSNRTITFTAEVWQENSSSAKLTIYSIGTGNIDSPTAITTGAWETVTVTTTLPTSLSELYFNVRSSGGAVGAIWYRNLRINYGGLPIGEKIYSPNDWIDFPRLLMLDIPKMFDGKPYQYEENRWYSWTPTLTPAGTSNSFTTEWRFSGKTCTTKGQIVSTHTSATWTHTLPIRTGTAEIIYTRHLKIQNNAGVIALGNWVQTTGNSTTANMYSSIANAAFNTVSGIKVAQIEMIEWEID
jgi:hypothetical protein